MLNRAELLAAVREMSRRSPRVMVGLAGPPGAGKSTLAEWLVDSLGAVAAYVPMDGYHLSNAVLAALGRADRKGAPDTFDAHGYVALLQRVRTELDHPVYAPRFHRDIEESIAAEIPIRPATRVVVTEGNYLLLDHSPWDQVARTLDVTYYVHVPEQERLTRLINRRIALGQPRPVAESWAQGSDQRNADLVATTRPRATAEISGS